MKRSAAGGGRTAAQWIRSVEDASLVRGHSDAVAAAARFDALVSPAERMALVREIVATRAAELTLAYRSVVMVTAGFKAREDGSGRTQVHAEPCVIFVVKRKWSAGRPGPLEQRLPARLLTYGGAGGARQLYAVPTDVQPARGFIGAGTRADGCVRLDDADPVFRLPGTLSCAVRAVGAGAAGRRLALSAMHVLNPVPPQALPQGGVMFADIGAGGQQRGSSSDWGGHIDGNTGSAFDVQLAEGVDAGWFNAAYHGWVLSKARPYVKLEEFDGLAATMRFVIVTPDNHPQAPQRPREAMLAQYSATVGEELPLEYQVRQGGGFSRVLLHHRTLIKLDVAADCPAPISGDSGSAVLSWWPDGSNVFVGVFIASLDSPGFERVAYVIPAWEVFDVERWSSLPPGTTKLVPGFHLS